MPSKKIILISLSLILFILFFVFILKPAHISVVSSCNPEKFKTEYPTYHIEGSFGVDYAENSTEPILTTYLRDEEDIPTKRHEFVHLVQYRQNRLFSCKIPSLKLFNEVESYIGQYTPDKIFTLIYGDYRN